MRKPDHPASRAGCGWLEGCLLCELPPCRSACRGSASRLFRKVDAGRGRQSSAGARRYRRTRCPRIVQQETAIPLVRPTPPTHWMAARPKYNDRRHQAKQCGEMGRRRAIDQYLGLGSAQLHGNGPLETVARIVGTLTDHAPGEVEAYGTEPRACWSTGATTGVPVHAATPLTGRAPERTPERALG